MPDKPEILQEKVIMQSKVFRIESLDLRFSNGQERTFERLSTLRGAVLIIPMLDADTVLLIREYAAGLNTYELGLPKGLIELDETAAEAANRELMEEVGYSANKLTFLTTLSLAPGYMSHQTIIFLAEDLQPQRLVGDEPEPIEVVPWSMHQLNTLFARDDMTEARSIAALFWAQNYLNYPQ